jgi:triosephosphate isomerase
VQTLVDGDKLKIGYGAQDISRHANGAYTGDISGSMLAKLGCSYVLCGHSERRQYHHEDDALVNAKIKAALAVSITPVLCVGEPLEVRQAGTQEEYVLAQLRGSLARVPAEAVASMVIAYEPLWAIGSGMTASADDAQQIAAGIRAHISADVGGEAGAGVRILYGGSVKADNIAPIMGGQDVDGVLVGGASLDAGQFASICRYHQVAAGRLQSISGSREEKIPVEIALSVVLIITSLVMVLLVLLHKGKGGGLSDMFGGGVSSTLGSSSVVERNLDRITIFFGVLWFIVVIALGWFINH